MRKIFAIVAFILLTQPGTSQNIQDPGTVTVFITVLQGNGQGYGSGFYCSDTSNKNVYLITASHVLIDTGGKRKSDLLVTSSYRNNTLKDNRDSFLIDLKAAELNNNFKFNPKSDVAVIKLGQSVSGIIHYKPFVTKITKENTKLNQLELSEFLRLSDLQITSDVITIGYPTSLSYGGDFDFLRPLVRHGIVSGIDYNKKLIITDCPAYHGNSGGPVFVKGAFTNTGEITGLIGIMSKLVPLVEQWESSVYGYKNLSVYNSGYSVIASSDSILEEIAKLGP